MAARANVLELIGNTPLVELTNLDTGPCRLFAKLENLNPGGSIKDRIALKMVEEAEKEGRLAPGGTIVEATSGNTGIGLTLVGRIKGYRVVIFIPDKMSAEKIYHLRALGAEVTVTRSDVPPGHPENYQDMARHFAKETPGAYYIHQHGNPHNPVAHEETTGPEIWEQMGHDLDAVVCGIGTAGTITGVGRYFHRTAPHVEMVFADPYGSIVGPYVQTGELVEVGSWLVEGIGEDELPPIGDLSLIGKTYMISDDESLHAARELLRREGRMGGSSTGTLIAGALKYCREQTEAKRVVTFVCDSGMKYLSKMYNDYWMADQGFIERETYGDLRDLIARRHEDHADYTVAPSDTLLTAYTRMKLYDVSQLPVVEDGTIVGLVDESDILLAVYDHVDDFDRPIAGAMARNLKTIPSSTPLNEVVRILEDGYVPLVVDGKDYRGLVTRIDLLNYLRRRMR
ncbi:MAG: pyridoxal-phosphate dependent enzyme [Pseudomonadota bacterium]